MIKTRYGVSLVMMAAAAAACGGSHKDAKTPVVGAAGSSSCTFKSNAEPLGRTGIGASLALAKVSGKRVAFVADEDAKSILTVDLDSREQIAETPLGARPSQVYVAKDGRVFVALRDQSQIAVFGVSSPTSPLEQHCQATTPTEPVAIAASPDDAMIVVTTGWGQKLAAFDGKTLATKFEQALPREPRSVVVSDDGKQAFVSHAVGSVMSVVELGTPKHEAKQVTMRGWMAGEQRSIVDRRKMIAQLEKTDPGNAKTFREEMETELKKAAQGHPSCQGFTLAKSSAMPGRIFAPQVMVDPGDPDARPDGYGDENQSTEMPSVAVIDEGSSEPFAASVTINDDARFSGAMRDTRNPRPECLLPRASAVDPVSKSLLVTCFGIDAVVAYDATSATPLSAERRRWTVGSGPTGVAIDSEKRRAVVWSQFDRTISTFAIGGNELVDDKTTPPVIQKTAMTPLGTKVDPSYALGRILFHAAGDMRISADGRACASCHPDGRDDAITWATPEGPRRSIMLAGRTTRTAPYSWNGNETTLHNHLGNTFDRLSGKGLRSIELDALVAYISQMPAPPPQTLDASKVAKGKAIFASAETQCASCHSGESFTDGQNHDVGSKVKSDRAASFNTPSLHLVGGTGPYFHDGRYATLGELLTKSDGKMGKTKHLGKDDMDALETYLRSL